MCGGGGSPQTQTTKSEPWSGVIPYLLGSQGQTGMSQASPSPAPVQSYSHPEDSSMDMEWLYNYGGLQRPQQAQGALTAQGPQGGGMPGLLPEASRLYGQGSMLASTSQQTEDALGQMEDRARGGSDLTRAAQQQNLATTRGDYLYGGPGFNAAFDAASRRIMPQVNSMFAGAGRRGGGLNGVAMSQALGDSFAGLYGQERNNQMQASAMAPGLANQDYFDISQLGEVGSQREQMAQQQLDEPYMRLGRYQGFINPLLGAGGTQTQTTPMYRNRASGALGGAMAGGSMFGPWGAAAGGLLGLL